MNNTITCVDIKDGILFLQGLIYMCLCMHFHDICQYTLHVCYVFNAIVLHAFGICFPNPKIIIIRVLGTTA